MQNYNEDNDEGFFLKVDVQYPENLLSFYNDLSILLEKRNIEKVEKLTTNLRDKEEYVIQKRNLKQALKSWISIEKKKKG